MCPNNGDCAPIKRPKQKNPWFRFIVLVTSSSRVRQHQSFQLKAPKRRVHVTSGRNGGKEGSQETSLRGNSDHAGGRAGRMDG